MPDQLGCSMMIVKEGEYAIEYDVESLAKTDVEGEKHVHRGEDNEVELDFEKHSDGLMLRPFGDYEWLCGKIWLEKLLSFSNIELVDILAVNAGFVIRINHGGREGLLPSIKGLEGAVQLRR